MAKITYAQVELEGGWNWADWPGLVNQAGLDALVVTMITRASMYVQWRVGATHYADVTEPKQSVLAEAEMHIAQEHLLRSAATVEAVVANWTVPVAELEAEAHARRIRAEELLAPYSQIQTPFARPTPSASATQPAPNPAPQFSQTGPPAPGP